VLLGRSTICPSSLMAVAAMATIRTKAAGAIIPAEASVYSFRHARISELLQVYGVDPITLPHKQAQVFA
jgi:hypothetical protein